MAKKQHLDPDILELKSQHYASRTSMGGMRLSTRAGMFVFLSLLVAAALGGGLFHIDQVTSQALATRAAAEETAIQVARVGREMAGARASERDFHWRRDPAVGETLKTQIAQVSRALDRLAKMEAAKPVAKNVATLREGLEQYETRFEEYRRLATLIGVAADQGLRADVQKATADLEGRFRELGLGAPMTQLGRIQGFGKEAMLPEGALDLAQFDKNYETLRLLVSAAKIPGAEKKAIDDKIKTHENAMVTMLNALVRLTKERNGFDDVYNYMAPNLEALDSFAARAVTLAGESLAEAGLLARQAIAGGAAGAILLVVIFGLVFLNAISSALRQVATAAARLAAGERAIEIPARGNVDSVGHVARALDAWMDTLADVDHLRAELEDTRRRLIEALAAPPPAKAAPEPKPEPAKIEPPKVEKVEPPQDAKPEPAPEAQPVPETPAPPSVPVPASEPRLPGSLRMALEEDFLRADRSGAGPIAAISQRLARYSQFVSAAAQDVERTESLIRGLGEATSLVIDLTALVAGFRDQINMLAFKTGGGPSPADIDANLVLFADARLPSDMATEEDERFDAIRETADRAERTVRSIHTTIVEIMDVAHAIAATSSNQALEATNQLLHQSESLHAILDDIISKIHPGDEKPGRRDRGPDLKGIPGGGTGRKGH